MKVTWVGCSPKPLKAALLHNHGDWEILLNFEGSGTLTIEDKTYPFYPGALVCVPPEMKHSKTTDETFRDLFMSVIDFPVKPEPIFLDDEDKEIENLMKTANKYFERGFEKNTEIINHIGIAVCNIIIERSKEDPSPYSESVKKFISIIHQNFNSPDFLLYDAVYDTQYNIDYFRRCFKKEVGCCPKEYINNLRIDYAKDLLRGKSSTKLSIAEISSKSGFSDFRYFSKVFKSKVGLSPSEYAKKIRLKEI